MQVQSNLVLVRERYDRFSVRNPETWQPFGYLLWRTWADKGFQFVPTDPTEHAGEILYPTLLGALTKNVSRSGARQIHDNVVNPPARSDLNHLVLTQLR